LKDTILNPTHPGTSSQQQPNQQDDAWANAGTSSQHGVAEQLYDEWFGNTQDYVPSTQFD